MKTSDFNQRFANYNCPHVGFYSDVKMKCIKFFGGMAEYYRDSLDQVVRDPFVPFVKSISSISRMSDGSFQESLLKEKCLHFLAPIRKYILILSYPILEIRLLI